MPVLRAESDSEKIAFFRTGLSLPLLTQCAAPNHRPYIHPILAPDGDGELTENQPGHHLWQHGLYVGLNDVNGVGFWHEGCNNSLTDGTFHPAPLAPPTVEANRASWQVVSEWRSPSGDPMLIETQTWRMEDRGEMLVLDMDWKLAALTDLRFGKYGYGGLFLRMPWRKETGSDLLSSEGATTNNQAEGQRARWVALSMPLPGRTSGKAGMAILDHSANPGHPAPWRVDGNYGIAPSRCLAGEWHLANGETTASRYRVLAYPGAIPGEAIEAEWQAFADSPATR